MIEKPFLQGEFFSQSQRSPVPFSAPALPLTWQHEHMVYLAASDYVFNTASRVYHEAGHMNIVIQNEHVSWGEGGCSSLGRA
jgi:lipopolysaccharide-binding protein